MSPTASKTAFVRDTVSIIPETSRRVYLNFSNKNFTSFQLNPPWQKSSQSGLVKREKLILLITKDVFLAKTELASSTTIKDSPSGREGLETPNPHRRNVIISGAAARQIRFTLTLTAYQNGFVASVCYPAAYIITLPGPYDIKFIPSSYNICGICILPRQFWIIIIQTVSDSSKSNSMAANTDVKLLAEEKCCLKSAFFFSRTKEKCALIMLVLNQELAYFSCRD